MSDKNSESDHDVRAEVYEAKTELAQLRRDRGQIDRLADKMSKYMEANRFAENLVAEILRTQR